MGKSGIFIGFVIVTCAVICFLAMYSRMVNGIVPQVFKQTENGLSPIRRIAPDNIINGNKG